MSELRAALEEYLALRRALGFKLRLSVKDRKGRTLSNHVIFLPSLFYSSLI